MLNRKVHTPDDLLRSGIAAIEQPGPVVIFDDDRFYMGGVLAELIVKAGFETVLVTPTATVSPWTDNTLEQSRIQSRLITLGVRIIALQTLQDWQDDKLILACVYTNKQQAIACNTLISATSKIPDEKLWNLLKAREHEWAPAGIQSVTRIGDCLSPGLIATACQSGHAYAQLAGNESQSEQHYRREDIIDCTKLKNC